MALRYRVESSLFVLPKEGARAEECEDAAAADDAALCYAVADGATEAFDAGRWARLLAEDWVRAQSPPTAADEFRAWAAAQGERLHAGWSELSLPWYAEEKRRAGSFAAFVGIRFDEEDAGVAPDTGGNKAGARGVEQNRRGERGLPVEHEQRVEPVLSWRAVALGDSCLVQTRGGEVVAA